MTWLVSTSVAPLTPRAMLTILSRVAWSETSPLRTTVPALELGPHGIRANVVVPGLTLTDATARLPQEHKDASAQMVPLKRNGLPEDVASAILLLASEEARFITGAYLPVSSPTSGAASAD